jgi:hypothetical protein
VRLDGELLLVVALVFILVGGWLEFVEQAGHGEVDGVYVGVRD